MPMYNFNEYLHSLNESAGSATIKNIVTNVISDGGKSKKYSDLFVDSNGFTAVGILHFTKSGLERLYEGIGDTLCRKYFKLSLKEMIASIKKHDGHEIDDKEWEKGMKNFLSSSNSIPVQDRVVAKKFSSYFKKYANAWKTDREYAIGVSIINSSPRTFKSLGEKYNWDAEKMMFGYCKSESDKHVRRGKPGGRCRTRCNKLGEYYPYMGDKNKYHFKGCEDLIDSNGIAVTTFPWNEVVKPKQTKDIPTLNKTSKSTFVNDKGVKVNKPTSDAIVIDDYDK